MMNSNRKQRLIDLGTATVETKGTVGVFEDHKGAQIPQAGLTSD